MELDQFQSYEQISHEDPHSFTLVFQDLIQMAKECLELLCFGQSGRVSLLPTTFKHASNRTNFDPASDKWNGFLDLNLAASRELYRTLLQTLLAWVPTHQLQVHDSFDSLWNLCIDQLAFDYQNFTEETQQSFNILVVLLETNLETPFDIQLSTLNFTLQWLNSYYENILFDRNMSILFFVGKVLSNLILNDVHHHYLHMSLKLHFCGLIRKLVSCDGFSEFPLELQSCLLTHYASFYCLESKKSFENELDLAKLALKNSSHDLRILPALSNLFKTIINTDIFDEFTHDDGTKRIRPSNSGPFPFHDLLIHHSVNGVENSLCRRKLLYLICAVSNDDAQVISTIEQIQSDGNIHPFDAFWITANLVSRSPQVIEKLKSIFFSNSLYLFNFFLSITDSLSLLETTYNHSSTFVISNAIPACNSIVEEIPFPFKETHYMLAHYIPCAHDMLLNIVPCLYRGLPAVTFQCSHTASSRLGNRMESETVGNIIQKITGTFEDCTPEQRLVSLLFLNNAGAHFNAINTQLLTVCLGEFTNRDIRVRSAGLQFFKNCVSNINDETLLFSMKEFMVAENHSLITSDMTSLSIAKILSTWNCCSSNMVDYHVSCLSFILKRDLPFSKYLQILKETCFEAEISKKLIQKFTMKLIDAKKDRKSLSRLSKAVGIGSVSKALQISARYILPRLVVSSQTLSGLEIFASFSGVSVRDLLTTNAYLILSYIFINTTPDNLNFRIKYLLELLRKELGSNGQNLTLTRLISSATSPIIIELILGIGHENPAKSQQAYLSLESCWQMLSPEGQGGNPDLKKEKWKDFRGFVASFAMHYLYHISSETSDSLIIETSHRKQSLKSLSKLISMIGSEVESVIYQVIHVLQSALKNNVLFADIWTCWAYILTGIPTTRLHLYLDEILVNAVNIYRKNHELGSTIVSALEAAVSVMEPKYFEKLFILPKIHPFEHLTQHVEKSVGIDLLKQFSLLSIGICHNNLFVVKESMLLFLSLETSILHDFVLRESSDVEISNLAKALISVCVRLGAKTNGDLEEEVKVLCARCLGKFGAIDPARISWKQKHVPMEVRFRSMPDSFAEKARTAAFSCVIMEECLYPAFQTSSSHKIRDKVSFVIQELLKTSGIKDAVLQRSKSTEEIFNRWLNLPQHIREAIMPFFSTGYLLKSADIRIDIDLPYLYNSQSFHQWSQMLCLDIIELTHNKEMRSYFDPFKTIIREPSMSKLVIYAILPTLILNEILLNSKERTNMLSKELLLVLSNDFQMEESEKHLCRQLVFKLIDHLMDWVRIRLLILERKRSNSQKQKTRYDDSSERKTIQHVQAFLEFIPNIHIASSSLKNNDFHRALFYFEKHIRLATRTIDKSVCNDVIRTCSQLDETDAVSGFSIYFEKLGIESDLERSTLENIALSKWSSVQTEAEIQIQQFPNEIKYKVNLLNAWMNLGHYESIISYCGVARENSPIGVDIGEFQSSAAWRLERWDIIDDCENSSKPLNNRLNHNIALALRCFNKGKLKFCEEYLTNIQRDLVFSISLTGKDSYSRVYEDLVTLHAVYEVSELCHLLENEKLDRLATLMSEFAFRLQVTQNGYRYRDFILELRRSVLSAISHLHYANSNVKSVTQMCLGSIWIKKAKISRNSEMFQTAYRNILKAEMFNHPAVFIEKARYHYQTGEIRKAISELSYVKSLSKQDSNSEPITLSAEVEKPEMLHKKDESYYALKSKLLLGKWMTMSESFSFAEIHELFKNLVQGEPRSESAWFTFGTYMNEHRGDLAEKYQKMIDRLEVCEKSEKRNLEREKVECYVKLSEATVLAVRCFSKALVLGSNYVFQSLPRLITIWLDYSSPVDNEEQKNGLNVIRDPTITAMNNHTLNLTKKAPTYIILTAFPQLVSRICHDNNTVIPILEKMIFKTLLEFPQQALWHLISSSKSSNVTRSKRANEIISLSKSHAEIKELSKDALGVADQLVHLANFTSPQKSASQLSFQADFSTLKRMTPLSLIVPIQECLTPIIPEKKLLSLSKFNVFQKELPTISGFIDQIDVMSSLARPKKIGIIGSDGKIYNFLCKPKDDLRKDARVLEFYGILNKLFKKDSESRKRKLHIRTYAVLPLNEECGLIEWVPETNTFRNVVSRLYKSAGSSFNPSKLRAWRDVATLEPNKLLEFFRIELLAPHQPPLFHQWFQDSFTEPSLWFNNRNNWSKTSAVMSMVGFVLGLGDRHLENILIDEKSGEAVHVDFNCLFDKGLFLDFPERVPFRLTHNMLDGFGVTGMDGIFMKSCEISLRVLRANKDTLMSILEAFVHDPLSEWTKKSSRSGKKDTSIDQGKTVLSAISHKLDGGLGLTVEYNLLQRKHDGSPQVLRSMLSSAYSGNIPIYFHRNLSVDAQVRELVAHATDIDLLCRMWIGWSAYY